MDSSEHHPSAALPCRATDFVSSQGVTGVNANADYVAWLNAFQIQVLQSLVADFGIAERLSSRSG